MIGKITKGSSFRGCVSYVLGKQDARLLEAEGVLADGIPAVVAGFQAQRMMNPDIRQPVGHISLSYAPEDAHRLTDGMMVLLAREYMEKMGIKDTQYIIARHHDQKHPHIHIVYNRIDNNGRTISDRNDRVRNVAVCKEMKEKYGLYFGKGKDRVRTHRLKGEDKIRYEIYHAVKDALARTCTWIQFVDELAGHGIQTMFKYKGKSDVVQGLSFSKDGLTFKASEIDRSFSYSKLDKQLGEGSAIGKDQDRDNRIVDVPGIDIQDLWQHGPDISVVEGLAGAVGGLFSPLPEDKDEENRNFACRKKKKKKRGMSL